MLHIPQPSMALNSHNVPPPDYRMWNTRKVAAHTDISGLMLNVRSVAGAAQGGMLRCLVINSHGSPGGLDLGKGIGRGETPLFTVLKGKVHTIIIVACEVARIGSATCSTVSPSCRWNDGNLFCGEIARNTGAYVFASTALQSPYLYYIIGLPVNYVDDYEGTIYRYNPNGSCKPVTNADISRWMDTLKTGPFCPPD
ncbi:MAG: hypothetical protein WCE61_07140 [Candidatus Acidiferrum sp.]